LRTRHDNRALAAAAAAASLYWVPGLSASVPALRPLLGIRDRLDDLGAVGLTFDDGPHPEGTPAVLEALREAGASATFFLAGEQVDQRPALVGEILAAGHEVGVHCQRHRNLLRLTPGQVAGDLQRESIIEYARGHIRVLDAARLGEVSCECYELIRDEYARVFEPALESRPM